MSAITINIFAQTAEHQSLTSNFDQILSDQFKANDPGATVLVAQNGSIIYHKAFGMADLEMNIPMQPDHIFKIGSVTKQFTAVAILQLMEQGKLSLQDEITKFIPDYPTHGHKITIEHLLTHTSGIQSYTAMKDFLGRMRLDIAPQDMIDYFKNEPMKFDPGTSYAYNNSGYFLLGFIIEKVSGKTYGEYIDENFFVPLGMTNSYYGDNKRIIKNQLNGYTMGEQGFENAPLLSMTQPYAAGSILSTVGDLFKWHQALHAGRIISKASLNKALTSYRLVSGEETNYGYGWRLGFIQESPTIEHGGGINGAQTMAIYLPNEDVFVAIFSNCDCNAPDDNAARLAALTIGKPYETEAATISSDVLQQYIGVYENANGELRIITVEGEQLMSQRGSNPQFPVHASGQDRFFFENALLALQFSRNENGEVDKLLTHGRDGTTVWNKTEKSIDSINEPAMKVDEKVLESYVGEYEVEPTFTFIVTRDKDKLFVQATGQDRFEVFASAENKFFLRINDARLEFIKDATGKVTKVILTQSGRSIDAKKIR